MEEHAIMKSLEVWTLQNFLDLGILLGFVVMGLVLAQPYLYSMRKRLTLRVSVEVWDVLTRVITDLLLAMVVLIGFVMLNPDSMADIKVGLPFLPVATVLFAVALVVRLFHGGHEVGSPGFLFSLWLIFIANLLDVIGFSLVMEAPSSEYLAIHPSPFWTWVKTNLRSNANLEPTQTVFLICFPIMLLIFVWAFAAGLAHIKKAKATGQE